MFLYIKMNSFAYRLADVDYSSLQTLRIAPINFILVLMIKKIGIKEYPNLT